jgi:hypothetical protein
VPSEPCRPSGDAAGRSLDQAATDQLTVHRRQGGGPHRVVGRDEPDARHRQQRRIQHAASVLLDERLLVRAPALLPRQAVRNGFCLGSWLNPRFFGGPADAVARVGFIPFLGRKHAHHRDAQRLKMVTAADRAGLDRHRGEPRRPHRDHRADRVRSAASSRSSQASSRRPVRRLVRRRRHGPRRSPGSRRSPSGESGGPSAAGRARPRTR